MMAAAERSRRRIPWAVLACAAAGLALFQFFGNATRGYVDTPSMFWWWASQWLDPRAETEHGWVILAVSGWLLARNARAAGPRRSERGDGRSDGPGEVGRGAWVAAAAMLAGLGLHAVGFVAQQTRISIVAFLVFTWGVVRLGGGRRWGEAAAFPLFFLAFAIPVNVLDSVGFWLRMWVVDAADVIARAAGMDVVRSGTQLFAADGRYHYDVAAACSGVRSLVALLALSLLIGYLEFRTAGRRALMALLCFPLTYLGNVVRIAAILVAARVGGQAWGERAHDGMGFGVFVIVLGGVLLAARGVRRWWPEPAETERRASQAAEAERSTAGGWRAGTAVLVVGLAVVEMAWLARVAAAPNDGAAGVWLTADGRDPVELPAFVGTEWIGRRAAVSAVEREVLPADTGFSRRTYVNLGDGRHAVFVSIVLSGRDRTAIHRPELCLVGQGWTIRGRGEHAFAWPGGGARVPATLLRTERAEPGGRRKVTALVAYWFVSADAVVATHGERFWHDAWRRLRGRADRWAYVLVQADAADGEAAALARMQAVLDGTLPRFQRVR